MEQKHTKLGIASFALSLLAGFGMFTLIAIAAILGRIRHWDHDVREVAQFLGAVCLLALVTTNIAAVGLGIAGLAQADRKKVFAILGTVFAALQLVLTVVVLANS
jgi:hypothetical protein